MLWNNINDLDSKSNVRRVLYDLERSRRLQPDDTAHSHPDTVYASLAPLLPERRATSRTHTRGLDTLGGVRFDSQASMVVQGCDFKELVQREALEIGWTFQLTAKPPFWRD